LTLVGFKLTDSSAERLVLFNTEPLISKDSVAEQFLHLSLVMRNDEDTIGGCDFGLALLVLAAAWLLIFQSSLLR
jgi:hypothetical protein